jgi:molybdopterin-guanine dinucleotide biosynthesis protein A
MVDLSCIVLAGGYSRRMGRDKRKLKVNGKTFFEIALENARKISSDVIVSLGYANQVEGWVEGVTVVFDEVKGKGPLYALVSSLQRCKKDYVAVLPVDAPLLKPDIYNRLLKEFEKDPSIKAVVPESMYGPEPLFGVYLVSDFLEASQEVISSGNEGVVDAIHYLDNVKFIGIEEFKKIDPKLLSFCNINTYLDFERLKERIND